MTALCCDILFLACSLCSFSLRRSLSARSPTSSVILEFTLKRNFNYTSHPAISFIRNSTIQNKSTNLIKRNFQGKIRVTVQWPERTQVRVWNKQIFYSELWLGYDSIIVEVLGVSVTWPESHKSQFEIDRFFWSELWLGNVSIITEVWGITKLQFQFLMKVNIIQNLGKLVLFIKKFVSSFKWNL